MSETESGSIDRQNHRAFRKKIAKRHRFRVAKRPLRAVAIAERFGGVNLNRPVPLMRPRRDNVSRKIDCLNSTWLAAGMCW